VRSVLEAATFRLGVLEHVRKPWIWIEELARVCKPRGLVITINPVSWPCRETPVDCWRAYPEGIRALYEEGNLEVLFSKVEFRITNDPRITRAGRYLVSFRQRCLTPRS
jgi:ubiquinone/menaquinone biosynthesis C-methylase UbiE